MYSIQSSFYLANTQYFLCLGNGVELRQRERGKEENVSGRKERVKERKAVTFITLIV